MAAWLKAYKYAIPPPPCTHAFTGCSIVPGSTMMGEKTKR